MSGISHSRMNLWLALLLVPLVVQALDYSDLQGNYCRAQRRPRDCCASRKDDCAVPILGTLCYCDEFCNRTRSEDCCPDYWSHCLSMEPPPEIREMACYHHGVKYFRGQAIKMNCNKCTCQPMGDLAEFLCETNDCLVDPEIISGVNVQTYQLGWTASNFTEFWGRRLDEGISLRLGTLQPQVTVRRMRPVLKRYDPSDLERRFDAREKWPGYIHGIQDQGWCGASWAISTAAVGSDRFAIMSKGMEKVELSPQHLLSCNNRGQRGCGGGSLDRAWFFLRKYGVVNEDCYRYTSGGGQVSRCRLPKKSNLLTARCSVSQNPLLSPRTDLYRMGPAYRLGSEQDIMHEIMESGPVQATMKVYQDFFMYRGGIYQQSKLGVFHRTGYHSVRIIGWGEEMIQGRPVKYWLVANSWGSLWGENGYFRIRRGVNECEIEDFVLASWADTLTPPVEKVVPDNKISNVI